MLGPKVPCHHSGSITTFQKEKPYIRSLVVLRGTCLITIDKLSRMQEDDMFIVNSLFEFLRRYLGKGHAYVYVTSFIVNVNYAVIFTY